MMQLNRFSYLLSRAADLFILFQLLLFASFLPKISLRPFFLLVGFFAFFDFLLYSQYKIRLRLSFFSRLFDAKNYISSIQAPLKTLFQGALVLLGIWMLCPYLESLFYRPFLLGAALSLGGALFSFRKKLLKESLNAFFLAEIDLAKAPFFYLIKNKKKEKGLPLIKLSGEESIFSSPNYPYLRSTKAFLGEKAFSIDLKRPHLIFLMLESFRAKNVGCLGAKIPLSPHFDKLAKEGILFTQFHSTGTITCRATIASLFGTFPSTKDWTLGRYASIPLRGIPLAMREIGYKTALLQSGHLSFDNSVYLYQKSGFDTILGRGDLTKEERLAQNGSLDLPLKKRLLKQGTSWGVYDELLMEKTVSFLKEQTQPTFLTLITVTNHHPWTAPPHFTPPPLAKGNPFYETFSYTDACLGQLIEGLKREKLLENTLFFIFGDHGQEDFIEKKGAVNLTLSQDTLHVPLLIYGSGIKEPKKIDTLASQIDLLPTILDLFENSSPHHSLGKSLLRKTSGPIYFAQPFDPTLFGMRKGDWKGVFSEEEKKLFNLRQDPEEKINLADTHREKIEELYKEASHYFSASDATYDSKSWAPFPSSQKVAYQSIETTVGDKLLDATQLDPFHFEAINSLKIDDLALKELGEKSSRLISVILSDCLMITDQGIKALLKNAQALEILALKGLDEVLGENWPHLSSLARLEVENCPRLGEKWLAWVQSHFSVVNLSLDGNFFDDAALSFLASGLKQLWSLELKNNSTISGAGLKDLFEVNPYLVGLRIENCPNLNDSAFEGKCPFHTVEITGAAITDATSKKFSTLSLKKATLYSCPYITDSKVYTIREK